MVTRCAAAADRPQIPWTSLLLTTACIAAFSRPAEAVLSVNATREYHLPLNDNIIGHAHI